MILERAGISFRFAWKQPRLRNLFFVVIALPLFISGVFLWRLLPVVRAAQTVVLHYTIYLGIDEVRRWPWIFLLPVFWNVVVWMGSLVALLLSQEDRLLSYTILLFLLLWSAPWAMALFYLGLLNLR